MDLNTIFLSLFGIMFIYAGYTAWSRPIPSTFNPVRSGLLVAQDTGKSKQIQSKTGDASMRIERVRRQTIKHVGSIAPQLLREGRTTIGSTTGIIETFLIGQNKA